VFNYTDLIVFTGGYNKTKVLYLKTQFVLSVKYNLKLSHPNYIYA
jgi:hypothetical protein